MLGRIWSWFGRNSTEQEDLRMFFEETTGMCFQECVILSKSRLLGKTKNELTEREKECIKKCTERKLKLFLEVEKAILKKVQPVSNQTQEAHSV
ncbi:hypothetical protein NEPAR06_0667 [Nematocida parisii]|nr:hypothetical protein NEPAR07_0408 [Nematocida parisii]KAI5153709.1 hypothetical protein NEPAR06_0667 [Nematocida parisii]KAI5156108.1 hypothetical protein NEPAR05_0285 [Nematocida parisii]